MKRFSFWIIISIFTFLIGLGAVLTWFYYNQKQIVEVEPVPLFDKNCLQSKSFPGLSKNISEIQKGFLRMALLQSSSAHMINR